MEEIRFKLSHSNNGAVIDGAVRKLRQIIRSKFGSSDNSSKDEIQLLWEQCKSENPLVAQPCSESLVTFVVEDGILELFPTLSTFLSIAPQVKAPSGLVNAIGDLLARQVKRDAGATNSSSRQPLYGIAAKPHPFISLLRSSPATWPHVHGKMREMLLHADSDIRQRALSFLKPVIMFIMCDPHHHLHFSALRATLLHTLLNLKNGESGVKYLLREVVLWLNFSDSSAFYENVIYAVQILSCQENRANATLPFLFSLQLQSIRKGINPRGIVLDEINALLLDETSCLEPQALEICLLLLAKCLGHSTTKHLGDLLLLASRILDLHEPRSLVRDFLATAVLPTLPHLAKLPEDVHMASRKILRRHHPIGTQEFAGVATDFIADTEVLEAQEVLYLLRALTSSPEAVEEWLCNVSSRKESFRRGDSLFFILLSLAYSSEQPDLADVAFLQLIDKAGKDASLSHSIMALVMYKLSSSDMTGDRQLKWLKQTPALGVDRNCISFILQLINSLATCPSLKPLRLSLLFDLWKLEDRIYPFLKKALEESEGIPGDKKFGFQLAKAKVLREICSRRPKQYGADLLANLSALLNDHVDDHEDSICTMALEGIFHLCKENVIDIRATCTVLSPKLWRDPRTSVVVKFMEILALAPTFDLQDSAQYVSFRRETLASLWTRLERECNPTVSSALLNTIARFKIQDFTLAVLPAFAKGSLKYPPGYNPPMEGPAPPPEEVLTYIPGDCWVHLVLNAPEEQLHDFRNIVQAILEEEIAALPRGVYYLNPSLANKGKEPPNYSYLNECSVLRAVVSFLQGVASGKNQAKPLRLRALAELLAHQRERSLPPFDWSLLQGLSCKDLLLGIACRQCAHSSSARRLTTAALESKAGGDDIADILFENMSCYANYVDDGSLTPFLEDSFHSHCTGGQTTANNSYLRLAVEASEKLDHSNGSLAATLDNLLGEAIVSNHEDFFFRQLAEISSRFPTSSIEKFSNFGPDEITDQLFERKLLLRSQLAQLKTSECPLVYMNAAIEAGSLRAADDQAVLMQSLVTVVAVCRHADPTGNRQWLLELMGRLRALSRAPAVDQSQLGCFFDAFAIAIVLFSGVEVLCFPLSNLSTSKDTRQQLLPIGVSRLLQDAAWSSLAPQLSEWMLQFGGGQPTAKTQSAIAKCFSAFQHCEKYYKEASMWSRLIPIG